VWSLVGGVVAIPIRTFFLGCVVVAGIYGGFTATRKILIVQAIPAAIALAVTLAIR
jgi:putative membrane protein